MSELPPEDQKPRNVGPGNATNQPPRDAAPPDNSIIFLGRLVLGVFIGSAAMYIGFLLYVGSGSVILLGAPLVAVLIATILFDVSAGKFGYASGVFLSSLVLTGLALVMLATICGGSVH